MSFVNYISTMLRCFYHQFIIDFKGDHRFTTITVIGNKKHYFCACELDSLIKKIGPIDE